MRLVELIRKGGLAEIATATVATIATHEPKRLPTVAQVATVAVAESPRPFDHEAYDERAAIIEANGVPREWAEGFAVLCTMPCPAAYGSERWQQIVDDGGEFLDRWGRQAAGLGWRAVDVFGVNRDASQNRYDGMGLVSLLEGHHVIAITADTARIDRGGSAQTTFYRKTMAAEAVAIWLLK